MADSPCPLPSHMCITGAISSWPFQFQRYEEQQRKMEVCDPTACDKQNNLSFKSNLQKSMLIIINAVYSSTLSKTNKLLCHTNYPIYPPPPLVCLFVINPCVLSWTELIWTFFSHKFSNCRTTSWTPQCLFWLTAQVCRRIDLEVRAPPWALMLSVLMFFINVLCQCSLLMLKFNALFVNVIVVSLSCDCCCCCCY